MNWRVWGIVAAAVLCVLATAAVYYLGYGLDPVTHFGAVFAAWVGGLILFLVAGSVVAIVSLAAPENESFDARARILFRRQTGKHIDYIVSKIKEALEHYAEVTENTVLIKAFDAPTKRYLVATNNRAIVRSYLDDVETTYVSSLKMGNVTAPPPGGQPNRLIYVRVAGAPIGTSEEFVDAIERPISCRVDRDGTCPVDTMMEFWVLGNDEPNTHTTRRYTQTLRLRFENLIPTDHPIEIKLTLDGTNWITEQLTQGVAKQVLEIKDVKPGTKVYEYRLLAP